MTSQQILRFVAFVVEGFKKSGLVSLPYTHLFKSARLRNWIPYRWEGRLTVREIYNAYRLVYEYEYELRLVPRCSHRSWRRAAADAAAGLDAVCRRRLRPRRTTNGPGRARLPSSMTVVAS